MSASTAPAARQKVLDLLTAALPTTHVTWGQPSETEDLANEMIYLSDEVTRTLDPGALGRLRFDEEYTFSVIATGKIEGDVQKTAELRGWALVDAIEQAIRADLKLGGVLNDWALFGEMRVITDLVPDGWVFQATVPLVCRSHS